MLEMERKARAEVQENAMESLNGAIRHAGCALERARCGDNPGARKAAVECLKELGEALDWLEEGAQ